ncbi:MAG: hypothetical protein ACYDAQ_03690 [Mycobacteriales bacterium]
MIATVVVPGAWGVARFGWGGCRLVRPGPRLPAGGLTGVLARLGQAGIALGAAALALALGMLALVARGRAAGVVVLAATQKPASDVVPTSIRDLVGYRLALRCTTPAASDTILGAGWAAAGVSAATIPAAARGVGYLLADGPAPVRLRCYRLAEPTLAQVLARGVALRAGASEVAR